MTSPELPVAGSDVEGFRVEDFPVACPNEAGCVCPARLRLVLQYVGNVETQPDGSVAYETFGDRNILNLKLSEQTAYAKTIGCEGATETFCPPRQAMNDNPIRKVGVKGARGIMKLFGIRGH